VSGWAQASLFAWLLILSAVVIYATTRSDEALERVKRLEDGKTAPKRNQDQERETPVKGPQRPQEAPEPPHGSIRTPPQASEAATEALKGSGALPAGRPRPAPAPPTAPLIAQPAAQPAETNAQRRAREDEAALIAWRAEQAKRHQRRHDDPKEPTR